MWATEVLPVSNGPELLEISSDFWPHSWKFRPFSRYAVTQDAASTASSFKCRQMRCLRAITWIFRHHALASRVCWERFLLILLKITWLLLLVAGKYFTPRWVSSYQLQRSRLRVMSYIHPSWPPTERSSLFHSAFALLNSKEVFFPRKAKRSRVHWLYRFSNI